MDLPASHFNDLELSTQLLIAEAENRNVTVKVLDKKDNFLQLTKNGKTEYIKQATRTSADNYMAPLIMENKAVTKSILENSGIQVPAGYVFDTVQDAMDTYNELAGQDIVIKPKSTNFGIGITIIKSLSSTKVYRDAVDEAFEFDHSIIAEEFIDGKEYRFLIIDNKVIGVLQRIAANVTGNGTNTISELVESKNNNPLRGIGYKKPLEQVQLGTVEKTFLKQQGKDFNTIPKNGEVVYLRKNSNISTGGDSIDYTDDMSPVFKEIAIKSAQAVGARICGADIIIAGSISNPVMNTLHEVYSVIELNFNPAIHIHGYPHQGVNRRAEVHILDLLGF